MRSAPRKPAKLRDWDDAAPNGIAVLAGAGPAPVRPGKPNPPSDGWVLLTDSDQCWWVPIPHDVEPLDMLGSVTAPPMFEGSTTTCPYPENLPTSNFQGHWSVKREHTSQLNPIGAKVAEDAMGTVGVTRLPPCTVEMLAIYNRAHPLPDPQNLSAYALKGILDGIAGKGANAWPDDNVPWVSELPIDLKVDRELPSIHVQITLKPTGYIQVIQALQRIGKAAHLLDMSSAEAV